MFRNPRAANPVDEIRKEADEWRITWEDGSSRTTTLAAIVWYAQEFDDEAEVNAL